MNTIAREIASVNFTANPKAQVSISHMHFAVWGILDDEHIICCFSGMGNVYKVKANTFEHNNGFLGDLVDQESFSTKQKVFLCDDVIWELQNILDEYVEEKGWSMHSS